MSSNSLSFQSAGGRRRCDAAQGASPSGDEGRADVLGGTSRRSKMTPRRHSSWNSCQSLSWSMSDSRGTTWPGRMSVPGASTEFAPILARSPTRAPNFSRPVECSLAPIRTRICLSARSFRWFAMTQPASRFTSEPKIVSPTKFRRASLLPLNTNHDFNSLPGPILHRSSSHTPPRN
jgi:hypothetical protein